MPKSGLPKDQSASIQNNCLQNSAARLSAEEILAIDKEHIWHPYAAANSNAPLYPVKQAQGCEITLHDGRKLLDGMSSWWSAIHGYNHPRLNAAATNQLAAFSHIMFGGFTHEPAARLAKQLVELSPQGLQKVFYSDSGSVSIEVAMKLALQYWLARGEKHKQRFLSFRHAYHGDTFKAMSVCDPVTGMHSHFAGALEQQIFCEAPACGFNQKWNDSYLDDLKRKLETHKNELAAVLIEPIVQGAGGMRFYSPMFLKGLRELCDKHNILLIADEIATGLGRTGKLFACEHANISPDILCMGKTLTAGYLTLAATLCTNDIAETICSASPGVFMHGPTYMGNALACVVACENIELLLEQDWQSNIHRIAEKLESGLSPARDFSFVADVRVLGAIGVVELHTSVDLNRIQPLFVEEGIWLRPFGKLVYMMPPYVMSDAELAFLCEKTLKVLNNYFN